MCSKMLNRHPALADTHCDGLGVVLLQGVQGQADKVEEQAEARQQTGDAEQQRQATAVEQEVKEAAPKEDLEDTLSVLQGAKTELQEQQSPQVRAKHLPKLQLCNLFLQDCLT